MRTKAPRKHLRRHRQRGAALILTVIVIMVLTTLGIAMVTFTTSEERTATTFRDSAQVRSVAEAGVRVVQSMFLTPGDRDLVPLYDSAASADGAGWDYWGASTTDIDTQLNEIGIWRKDRIGADPARYSGPSNQFLKPPFGQNWGNVFGGEYTPANDRYDLKFNCKNPASGSAIANWQTECWLETNINPLLLGDADWNLDTGRITDISFYAPPNVNEQAYGIATVRVTAEKRTEWPNGTLIASETIVAVIGDITPKPAVMGDGDVDIGSQGGRTLCGDGCENIHANGDATVGDISGGEDPMVTATDDAPGTDGDDADFLEPPEINPWDLAYKPTVTAELNKYYLVTARRLDSGWRDGVAGGTTAPRPCGNAQLALCQDYNLEYDAGGTARSPRSGVDDGSTLNDNPFMYRWNKDLNEWTECDADGNDALSCAGGPTFSFTRGADTIDGDATDAAGKVDQADIPFHKNRVPTARFEIQSAVDGATVLVDGKFYKHGNMNATMSIIAAGSIHLHSNTTWYPALSNKVTWLAGRDIYFHSDCCTTSAFPCPWAAGLADVSGVIAAHEQILGDSNNHLGGIVIAENEINIDLLVNTTAAINLEKADHGYTCGAPSWPWALPTKPEIFSMTTATN